MRLTGLYINAFKEYIINIILLAAYLGNSAIYGHVEESGNVLGLRLESEAALPVGISPHSGTVTRTPVHSSLQRQEETRDRTCHQVENRDANTRRHFNSCALVICALHRTGTFFFFCLLPAAVVRKFKGMMTLK